MNKKCSRERGTYGKQKKEASYGQEGKEHGPADESRDKRIMPANRAGELETSTETGCVRVSGFSITQAKGGAV